MLGLGRYNAVGSPIAALATRLEALTERLLHSWVLSEHRLDVSELDDDRCSVSAPASRTRAYGAGGARSGAGC